LEPVDENGDIV